MQEKIKIAVVGATGRLGRHVVDVLDAAHDVVPISRSQGVDARTFAADRGDPVRVEEVTDPTDPDRVMEATGGLLPGPHATIAGPTFTEWLKASRRTMEPQEK